MDCKLAIEQKNSRAAVAAKAALEVEVSALSSRLERSGADVKRIKGEAEELREEAQKLEASLEPTLLPRCVFCGVLLQLREYVSGGGREGRGDRSSS